MTTVKRIYSSFLLLFLIFFKRSTNMTERTERAAVATNENINSFDFGFCIWLPKKVKDIKNGREATKELER